MIRTHLVLSMFIVYEASSATRLRIGLFYRDLASLQTFEQVTRKSVSLTNKGRRCGGVAPRLVRDSCRAGLEPRAVAENECTVARPRPPPIRSDSKVKHETPLTPEYARGKETRTVPRARHRTEASRSDTGAPAIASIHPTGRVASRAYATKQQSQQQNMLGPRTHAYSETGSFLSTEDCSTSSCGSGARSTSIL